MFHLYNLPREQNGSALSMDEGCMEQLEQTRILPIHNVWTA